MLVQTRKGGRTDRRGLAAIETEPDAWERFQSAVKTVAPPKHPKESMTMADVRHIKSTSEIPSGQKYVLVMYGPENNEIRHSRGVNLVIQAGERNDDIKKVKFATTVEDAQRIAERENIPTVYVVDSD